MGSWDEASVARKRVYRERCDQILRHPEVQPELGLDLDLSSALASALGLELLKGWV